jgi:hypothetical protein
MFGTIRKHQTWLWAVIITLTIISFVFFFSPYSKFNDSRRAAGNFGSINGERITQDDFYRAYKEICLRTFVTTGQWPDEEAKKQGGDVERETYQWLLLVQKQKQLGVHVNTDVLAQSAKAMMGQLERAKVIPSPDVFLSQVLPRNGYGIDDFERFVRHYMGVQELIAVVGVAGRVITPQEIRDLYTREHQELSAAAVFFSASNYLAGVAAPADTVTQFYTNRQAVYRIPERVQVSYVRFDLTNFAAEANQELAKITNMDLQIEEMYRQHGSNFLNEAKARTLEEAKTKIRDNERKRMEMTLATKKAREFATVLADMQPTSLTNLNTLAKEKGLAVRMTTPFDLRDGPKDLDVGQDFAEKAFKRTADEPFAGPILGMDGVYVLAVNQKIPSEIPPLVQIRDQVERDYKLSQALNLARKAGMEFYQTLTNDLAKGKTVAAICAEAKVKLVDLPPFSLSTRSLPEVEEYLPMNQFKQIAFATPVGKPSPFQMTAAGGVVVYLKAKLPLDEATMNANMTAFANAVRQSRQNEVFNEWFNQEARKGLRDTPLAKPQTPPSMGSSPKAKKS